MSPRQQKGLTMIELLMSVAITAIVMTTAVAVVVAGTRLARRNEEVVNSNEAARDGMEAILKDIKLAGMGGSAGVYVVRGGVPERINSIFGRDTATNATGTAVPDELWLIVPQVNVLNTNCMVTDPTGNPTGGAVEGGSAIVTTSVPAGSTSLSVNCTSPLLTARLLMISHYNTAALVRSPTFPTTTSVTSADLNTAGFSSSPVVGGYSAGDLVYPVDIIHYSIQQLPRPGGPACPDPSCRRNLVRSKATINTSATGLPFTDPGTSAQVYPHVEDLQLAFALGDGTANIEPTFNSNASNATVHLYPPSPNPLFTLRSVRVTVVGRSELPLRDENNGLLPLTAVDVENNTPVAATPVVDGYRRSVYRRRIELLNLNAESI